MTSTTYCDKIEEVLAAMIHLSSEVLPENRRAVQLYIHRTWARVLTYLQSLYREEGTEELRSRFASYVSAEEARLQRNFEDIKYRIDSPNTFSVIAGEGRLETVNPPPCDFQSLPIPDSYQFKTRPFYRCFISF